MRVGFVASHNGSALRAVLAAQAADRTRCVPAVVISNNSGSGALEAGAAAGLPVYHLSTKTHPNAERLDGAIRAALEDSGVTHVVLSGYLRKLGPQTLDRFRARVLNVHPALLPAFGGPGMWGRHVHEAVIAARSPRSGATVHLVDADYDTGPIVKQDRVDVLPSDTWHDLANRVAGVEGPLVVDTINEIAAGQIDLDALVLTRPAGHSRSTVPIGTARYRPRAPGRDTRSVAARRVREAPLGIARHRSAIRAPRTAADRPRQVPFVAPARE